MFHNSEINCCVGIFFVVFVDFFKKVVDNNISISVLYGTLQRVTLWSIIAQRKEWHSHPDAKMYFKMKANSADSWRRTTCLFATGV